MAKKVRHLDLANLSRGMTPGITPTVGRFTAEAAAVLMEHNSHKSGIEMEVVGKRTEKCSVTWPKLHPDAKRSHNDLPAAVEQGAYGIAFLLVREFTDLKVIERSAKRTGIDYWLGAGDELLFQRTARLEVSGIINDVKAIDGRVKTKMKQTDASKGRLPAFVAVVEFGQPKSVFNAQ